MILPLGDAPNPRGVPVATYLLLAANIVVFGLVTLPLSSTAPDPRDPRLQEYVRAVKHNVPENVSLQDLAKQVSAYDLVIFEYGFRPAHPSLSAMFTALFLHAGFFHLLGNMLFLWIYGDNVEHRLGPLRYLAVYIVAGFAATSFYGLLDSDSPLPLVGASGAISGILGCYFIWFPHNRVRLFVFFFPIMMETVFVRARIVLGAYLVLDNVLPMVGSRGGGGGVAYGAHIGGFLAGLMIALIADRRQAAATPSEFATTETAPENSRISELRDAVAGGRYEDAARTYFSLPPNATRGALSGGNLLQLADWLGKAGHEQAALVAYRRLLRDEPNGPLRSEAHVGAGRLLLSQGELPAAYQHFLDALNGTPSAEVEREARQAIEQISARSRLRRR